MNDRGVSWSRWLASLPFSRFVAPTAAPQVQPERKPEFGKR